MKTDSAVRVAGEPVVAMLLERPLVVLVGVSASIDTIAMGREEAVLGVEGVLSSARHCGEEFEEGEAG